MCYENNRPTRTVNIDSNNTVEIPNEKIADFDKEPTFEDFIESVTKRAEEYRKFVEKTRKNE